MPHFSAQNQKIQSSLLLGLGLTEEKEEEEDDTTAVTAFFFFWRKLKFAWIFKPSIV